MEAITIEEKIDYIYTTLKKNQRNATIGAVLKWGFRLAILGYMYYFFTVGVPAMIDKIVPSFASFGGEEQTIDADKVKEMLNIPGMKDLLDSYMNK